MIHTPGIRQPSSTTMLSNLSKIILEIQAVGM